MAFQGLFSRSAEASGLTGLSVAKQPQQHTAVEQQEGFPRACWKCPCNSYNGMAPHAQEAGTQKHVLMASKVLSSARASG
jgi:hypothetical protein